MKISLNHFSKEFQLLLFLHNETTGKESAAWETINWQEFIGLVQKHRTTSIVHEIFKKNGINIPPTEATILVENAKKSSFKMLAFTKEIISISKILQQENIEFINLKGPIAAKQIYNDFTAKNSRDIDVLIDPGTIDNCLNTLIHQGYELIYPYLQLNQAQKRYFNKVNNQLALHHPVKKIRLEIHWRLFANKHMLPYNFEELAQKRRGLKIGKEIVYGLGEKHLFIYLCTHGAKHAWAKLYWLVEVFHLLKEIKDLAPIMDEAKKMRVERTIYQALILIELHFDYKYKLKCLLSQEDKKTEELIAFSLKAMEATNKSKNGKVNLKKEKAYRLKLFDNLKYKLAEKKLLSINDFVALPLPAYLFFLYYPLRPFIWTWRRLSKLN